jgi:hypothetical protein
MKLTLTVSQDVSNKTFSESYVIELENMKHDPELLILDSISHLKMALIKKIDNHITHILSGQETSGELFKRIIKDE